MNLKLKKLISYYKPYKKTLILDLLFSVLSALIYIAIPTICHYITSEVFGFEKSEAIKTVFWLAGLVFVLFTMLFLFKKYSEHKGMMFAARVEADMKNELFRHFQKQAFGFFDERKIGKMMSYITTDAYNLTKAIKYTPEILLSFIIRVFGTLIILFFKNPIFACILLSVFVLIFIFMGYIFPKVYKINAVSRDVFSNLTSDLEENLSGIKTIQSFTNEQDAIFKFESSNKTYLKTRDKMHGFQSTLDAGLLSFIIGLIPIMTIVGSFFVINGYITVADLIMFMLFMDIVIAPFFEITFLNEFFREGMVGFNRVFEVLNVKPKVTDSPNAVSLENIKGNIEFKDVNFHYAKANTNIFENLNLKIHAGEYIALVGPSGVGKSTLCNLIPRFYDVSSGKISVDGFNIKNIKLKNLRQSIGFVHQDTFLFSGTIIENIRYGKPNANDEEIFEASKNAYAHDFIMSFPDGYNTVIGQRGARLSGGQKQRLAIARVFLKNPPILIFDEATSSLDNESERYIQKSMEKLAENRTTIVIAHRLSTIKNAKRILVMANGKIAEQGTHEELLEKNGVYAEFYNLL